MLIGLHVSAIFSHLQTNMEPEFRNITCALDGIRLRLQNNS